MTAPASAAAGATPAARSDGRAGEADGQLRVLVDVNHPAQVHLFRHAMAELRRRGHETFVTSREKEVTVDLLDAYGIEHVPLTSRGSSTLGLALELLRRERRLLGVAREFRPHVLLGRLGPAPAHVAALVGARFVAVDDTHIDSWPVRRAYHSLTLPFVDTVCAPPSLDLPVDGARRRPLDFQELAYLHPRYFEPDPSVLTSHGVDPAEPYFVVRLAGWDAYHDVGHRGLSPAAAADLVSLLEAHGTVYVSAERSVPPALAGRELPTPPEHVHQVLYHADLYVGDSGTMSTEAAMLGTPAVRTNSMVGNDENVFRELERRYGLLRSFADEERAIEAVEALLDDDVEREEWRRRRARLVEEQPDVTERIVEAVLEAGPRATRRGLGRPA